MNPPYAADEGCALRTEHKKTDAGHDLTGILCI